ncbi:MAG: glycosyltransferase family 2 protein [Clostridiaceae bacterium]|nr:glycosyltransferase family 2 protein [Clostridiaceae bacterium]
MSKTSCVILNYNDAPTALKLVERIISYSCLDDIILVDNHSTDDSCEQLKRWEGGRVHLLLAEKNGGYGSGNNIGIRYALEELESDYIVIANPDVVFSQQCVYDMKNTLENRPEYAMVSAMVKGTDGNTMFSCWKLLPMFGDLLDTGLVTRRLFKRFLGYGPSHYRKRPFVEADAVPGSFFMVKAAVVRECGPLFDEEVFLYYEEKILGQKLKKQGKKTLLLTSQSYIHAHSVTIDKTVGSIGAKQKILHESKLYYYKKYLGAGPVKMAAAKVFLGIVMLEIQFLTRVCRLRW